MLGRTPKIFIKLVFPGLAIGVLILFSYGYFFSYHLDLPLGCDQFGYLNLSEDISQGKVFTNPEKRPFESELIPYLRQSHFKYHDYAWMITPHAHHLDQRGMRIINQYPPGTSLLLSLFPIHLRQVWFAPICLTLLIFLLLLSLMRGGGNTFPSSVGIITILSCILIFLTPFNGEFKQVNSLAPTYGILIAAGYLLTCRTAWSLILLGTAIIFRVVNVIFIPAFVAVYLIPEIGRWNWKIILKKILASVLLVLAGGMLVYLVYAWLLTGSPFAATYSVKDQAFTGVNQLIDHLRYYISWQRPWFNVHAALIILMFSLSIWSKRIFRWAVFAFIITALNYGFFILHRVTINYYPYAASMLIIGILIASIEKMIPTRVRNILFPILMVPIIIFLAITITIPEISPKDNFNRKTELYQEPLEEYDVIWGSLRTGTAEYATGRAAFRFLWGPRPARISVIRWLYDHGYSQAFMANDEKLGPEWIEWELSEIGLNYSRQNYPQVGTIISVDPP
jgi:hypothetical protein